MEEVSQIAKQPKPRTRKRSLPSIVNQTFGMLTVLEEHASKMGLGKTTYTLLVRCKCGIEKVVDERSVRRGLTISCGSCANKTHGQSKSNLYAVWRSMLARCNTPSHKAFHNYGGRNIKVCPEWLVFENFQADMVGAPFKGSSLDRIDNNKGYSVGNCRWVNWVDQARNKRSNVWIEYDGHRKTIAEWVTISGLKYNTFLYRYRNGWGMQQILSTETNFANRKNTLHDC